MEKIQKNFKVILLCAGFIVVICLALVLARPSYAGTEAGLGKTWKGQWLSQYEGEKVKITFVEAPTYVANDLNKVSYLELIEAGPAGIVVGFRPQRTIFFPYHRILSIEPIYKTR